MRALSGSVERFFLHSHAIYSILQLCPGICESKYNAVPSASLVGLGLTQGRLCMVRISKITPSVTYRECYACAYGILVLIRRPCSICVTKAAVSVDLRVKLRIGAL